MSESVGDARGKKKPRGLAHIFVLLLSVIVIAMIATYMVPAGKYERVMDEKSKRMVIVPSSFQYV